MNCSKCDAFYSYDNYLRETVPSALLQFFQEHEETVNITWFTSFLLTLRCVFMMSKYENGIEDILTFCKFFSLPSIQQALEYKRIFYLP